LEAGAIAKAGPLAKSLRYNARLSRWTVPRPVLLAIATRVYVLHGEC